MIEMELRRLRREEEERGCNGRGVTRDEKLWAYMPEGLLRRHNIRRSLASCKYYWGRFGREKSGFDERIKKVPNNLSTSVQNRRRQLKSVKNGCIDLKSTHLLYHCDVKWVFLLKLKRRLQLQMMMNIFACSIMWLGWRVSH